jgi:hypothetical protein
MKKKILLVALIITVLAVTSNGVSVADIKDEPVYGPLQPPIGG